MQLDVTKVAAIEQRIDRMLGATEPDPEREGKHLAGLEIALLEALHTQDDPYRGNPMLAHASAWRDLAHDSGAPDGAARADELVARLIDDSARSWLTGLTSATGEPAPDSETCFRRLADARTMDLEALSLRDMAPPLRDHVPELREAYLAALAASPPTLEQRRAWVTELVDRADVMLTGIDDVEPRRADVRIQRVVGDLRWHVDNVEPKHTLRRASLKRKVRRLHDEGQERDLQYRVEQRFGQKTAARFERTVLLLIVLVLVILAAEVTVDFSKQTLFVLATIDLAACLVFLTEFFVKLSMVRGKRRWFARHAFVDLVPSIPFAFLLRWARALRFLRFLRIARYIRVAQPMIRVVRAFGFLTRGVDRIVRKYGSLLNRNIVLYPTRTEREAMKRQKQDLTVRLRRLQARLNERWEGLLAAAPQEEREAVAAARVNGLERSLAAGFAPRRQRSEAVVAPMERDVAADAVLDNLGALTAPELEAEMGQDFVARVARAVRLFAYPPLRWLPVIRRYVPRVSRGMDDADVVVAAARKSATELRRHHDRYFWFADLHGTVTPAQFVDRVGSAMVNAAKRPAVRLAVFGGIVLLLHLVFREATTGLVGDVQTWLGNVVGTFLKVVGTICFAILAVGWYLRRVAGQATDFFTQSARAQYLGLTEVIKGRHLDRDSKIFDLRVFGPERIVFQRDDCDRERFCTSVRRWLLASEAIPIHWQGFDPVDRAVWIYRDSLDGALFGINDTHATGQLLGNPALRNMRLSAERITKKDSRTLAKLDLDRQKSMFRGPYLWFSLICKAVEHGVARLLVDYNRHALPLGQLPRASEDERRNYEHWLDTNAVSDVPSDQVIYVTNDFTALHFLDVDPERDAQVEARFGPRVLERMRRDRRLLTRRIFGTYPLHKRPRDERVLNLYRVYHRWLAGGRALLIPFRLFWNWLRYCGHFVRWVARCVREIRHPAFHVDVEAAEGADYRSALRKIRRMRGPAAEAALRMRARFDPEYFGLQLPGVEADGKDTPGIDEDLEFLGSAPSVVRELALERRRAARDMARLGRLIEGGLFTRLGITSPSREHVRAAAAAYLSDTNCVRRHLSAQEIVSEVFQRAAREELNPFSAWPHARLRAAFKRWWNQHGTGDAFARRAAWRATVANVDGVRNALLAWSPEARATGEQALGDILRRPERITEQLVTLRTVQTLSLIDILSYRAQVYRLGDYAESGDDPGTALELAT